MSYQINPCHEWGDHAECPGCAHESHRKSEPAPTPERPTTEEGEENLYELRKGVDSGTLAAAQAWSKKQAETWPHGTYSPNDFPPFFEKGCLWGLREGKRLERERLKELLKRAGISE